MHLAPEVALGAVNRWGLAVQEGLEAVDNSLVVNKNVHRPFGGGHEVEDGERFGTLGVLGKPVHARRMVEPMLVAVVDAEGSAGEEGDGLVRAGAIGARVDPTAARMRVRMIRERVAIGAFWGRPWDRLRGVAGKLRL